MKEKTKPSIQDLSKHLFWDVDPKKLNLEQNKKLVIQRVLDYGLITDWKIIYRYYGIDEIKKNAVCMKDLDKKSASFISVLTKTPLDQFACFSTKPSTPQHWNF